MRASTRLLLVVLGAWGLAVVAAVVTGALRAIPSLSIAPIIAVSIVAPVIVYARSARVRDYFAEIGLRRITAFHIWRIPAALVFFWYGAHDRLPEVFVRNAGWGDLAAGTLALAVTVLPPNRARFWAFHLVGFTDFVVAVGTGLTLVLRHDPRMAGIQTLPMALIPFYGVGISGATHLIAFHLLKKSS